MPVEFEIVLQKTTISRERVACEELQRACLSVPLPYFCPTPERERIQDEYRDKAIEVAGRCIEQAEDGCRIVVWGRKIRSTNGQTTTWRAFEARKRNGEVQMDYLDQCDYLNLKQRPSGKR